MSVEGPTPRRFARAEYYEMDRLGWFIGQRVELIDGCVMEFPAMTPREAAARTRAKKALEAVFGPDYWPREAAPLNLGRLSTDGDSEPQPDLAVVPGGPRDYSVSHPATALLVVEASESTLKYDREEKASLYALARIQDYWIINLVGHRLEVYREPEPTAFEPFFFTYGQVTLLGPADFVTPLARPRARIAVADLLP